MSEPKKTTDSLGDFFDRYREHIGALSLVNLFLALPLVLMAGGLLLLSRWVPLSLPVVLLPVILWSPLMAGGCTAAVKLKTDPACSPVDDFKTGVRSGGKVFLIHSLFQYVVVLGLSLSYSYYLEGLDSALKWVLFGSTLLFTLFFICFENSLLTMLAGVDLPAGAAVRNAVILTIGGFVGHLKTIFTFLLIAAVLYTLAAFSGQFWVFLLILAAVTLLCLPMLCLAVIVHNAQPAVWNYVVEPFAETEKKPSQAAPAGEDAPEDDPQWELLCQGDPEEYVFLQGRMVRRGVLQEKLRAQKGSKADPSDT